MKITDHCDRCLKTRTPKEAAESFDAIMSLDKAQLKRVKKWLRSRTDGKQALCPKCIRELANDGRP